MEMPTRPRVNKKRLRVCPIRKRPRLHLSAQRPNRLALHIEAFFRMVSRENRKSHDFSLRFSLWHRQRPWPDAVAEPRGHSHRCRVAAGGYETARESAENRRLLGAL